uniref:Uncharacterized protein n=1 Tax=Arundo donax TaxID=35708 RepID=A0A0A9H5P8_ARUDO
MLSSITKKGEIVRNMASLNMFMILVINDKIINRTNMIV